MNSAEIQLLLFALLGKYKIATLEQIDVGAIFRKTV